MVVVLVVVVVRVVVVVVVMVMVRVRVRVRRNAERHNLQGRKSGNLRFLLESEKAVDNGCKCGPVACFVLRVEGTH